MREREMVFCYQNCSDLLWEKIVPAIENLQNFEITRTIYSNSERSEQFLVIFVPGDFPDLIN